jgi:hypothetical protein
MTQRHTGNSTIVGSILASVLFAACVVGGLELVEKTLAPHASTPSAQTAEYASLSHVPVERAE